MKKSSRRKTAFFVILIAALAIFVAFKQAQQTARVQPRYIIERVHFSNHISEHDGLKCDRQIKVTVKDRWPFFAQPRPETTSWGLNDEDEYVLYRIAGQERGDTEIWEHLQSSSKRFDRRWLITYDLPISQIPKGATEAYLTAVIVIGGNRSGVSTLPVKVRLK